MSKLVIFAHHKSVITSILTTLEKADISAVAVTGATTPGMTQEHIDIFTHESDCKVFIGQLDKCATAINLQSAQHAWFAESSWTPSTNAQASKRIHRIGQDHPCFITVFSLADSLDQAVNRVLLRKTTDTAQLYGAA